MHTPILRLAFAAALIATPGLAAAEPFEGPHVEAVAGWNHVEKDGHARSGDGVVYGGSLGYDIRSGKVAGGALAEINDSSGSACSDLEVQGKVAGKFCSHSGRSIFAGARLGFVAGEHTLLYVLGGYVNVRQRESFEGGKGAPLADRSFSKNRDGFRVGAGAERAISKQAFIKAEYRYTDVKGNSGAGQHQILTGVGIRF